MNPYPLATFLSYSHANQKLRTKLRTHFVQMERDGLIRLWDDRELEVGQELNTAIGEELELTEVFILLVSADFIASPYCSGIEMKRALERHEEGTALVLPIIVAPCEWQHSPLAKLVVAPTDGKPVSAWRPTDGGWKDAAALARKAIVSFREQRFNRRPAPAPLPAAPIAPPVSHAPPLDVPAPVQPPPRVEKTELVPLYVTLPGFELPKAQASADQEETAQMEAETLPLQMAAGAAEATEAMTLDLPPAAPEITVRLLEPARPPPPAAVEQVARPHEPAPPPREEGAQGARSWRTIGMVAVPALLLMVVMALLVCHSPG